MMMEIVPSEMKKLRACLACSLVKTEDQFYETGCDSKFCSSYDNTIVYVKQPSTDVVKKFAHIRLREVFNHGARRGKGLRKHQLQFQRVCEYFEVVSLLNANDELACD